MYYIYLITNTINSKVYVGQTKNWSQRWKEHVWESGRNCRKTQRHLYSAMKLYGVDSFCGQIICSTETEDSANRLESYYILEFDSIDPDKGYNLKEGGARPRNLRPESIKRISDAQKINYSVPEKSPRYRKEVLSQNLVDLYQKGRTITQISNITGLSVSATYSRLLRLGIKIRGKRKDIDLSKAKELYEKGWSGEEIAKEMGILDRHCIIDKLRKEGVFIRRPGARAKNAPLILGC